MHLVELDVRRAPGLPPAGVSTGELKPGLVLLYGPNASGKSTLGRVMRGMLWPELSPASIQASARWRLHAGGPVVDAALLYGRTQWSDGAPEPLDDALATATHLRLQDLLDADNTSDQQIALQIQRQLDGGFDLAGLSPITRPSKRPGRSLKQALTETTHALKDRVDSTDALVADESRLQALDTQAGEAKDAPRRLQQVDDALARLDLQEKQAAVQERLQALPDVGDGLSEGVDERLKEIQEELEKAQEEQRRREADVVDAQRAVEGEDFPSAHPTLERLDVWGKRAAMLREQARSLRELGTELEGARARLHEARGDVHADRDPSPALDRNALERLTTALDALTVARTEVHRHPTPAQGAPTPLDPEEEERLGDARRLLGEWLVAPRQLVVAPRPATGPAVPIGLVAVGLLLCGVGLVLAVLGMGWPGGGIVALGTALVGVGLGLWLGPRLAPGPESPPASEAEALRQRYQAGDHPTVDDWSPHGVQAVLDEIRADLAASSEARAQAGLHARRVADAEDARRGLEKAREAVEEVVAELDLDPSLPGLALSLQAARLRTLAEARDEVARLQGEHDELARVQAKSLDELQQEVSGLGLHDPSALADPATLTAAVDALRERLARLRSAEEALALAHREHERAAGRLRQLDTKLDGMLGTVGLTMDTLHTLHERMETWRTRQGLTREHHDLQRQLDRLDLPDDLPETRADLESRRTELLEAQDSLDAVHRESATIRQAIRAATEGRTIQDAIGAVEEAENQLAADRDQQLQAQAEVAILDWLRAENAATDAPKLLQRARERFLDFTHNRYELVVDPDHRFLARDLHRDRLQPLSELSDGTRIQLLLAARLAWLESAEGDTLLPLFLDEVLSITDAERFEAIGRALLKLCAEGRQLFYATADPAEVHAWQDLCERMGLGAAQLVHLGTPTPDTTWVPPPSLPAARAELPELGALDAVAWTREAGLHRPDLHDDASVWPLSLLLHDALDEARAAIVQGLRSGGQLALADRGIVLPLSDERLVLARTRVLAIQATLDGLRIGRGRPVAWADLEASGTITPAFEDRVRAIVGAHGHDPQRVYDEVCDLSRFRTAAKEDLLAYLEEHGFLDPSDPLPHEAVVARAQMRVREGLEHDVLTLADVEAMVTFVEDVVEVA